MSPKTVRVEPPVFGQDRFVEVRTTLAADPPPPKSPPRGGGDRLDGQLFRSISMHLTQGCGESCFRDLGFSLRLPLREVFSKEPSVRFPGNERRMSD